MTLLIAVLCIFFAIILWSTFWKITKFMISLFIGVPYRLLMNQTTWGRLDREPSPFVDDDSSIWMQGKSGIYFRYDLAKEGKDWETQIDKFNEFRRQEGK